MPELVAVTSTFCTPVRADTVNCWFVLSPASSDDGSGLMAGASSRLTRSTVTSMLSDSASGSLAVTVTVWRTATS